MQAVQSCNVIFFAVFNVLMIKTHVFILRDSPPNTPQRDRNAERQRLRQQHILDSPEARRIPSARRRQSSPPPFRIPELNSQSNLI